jgi:hypothetical protein
MDELLPLVTNIINTSMEASYVPTDFISGLSSRNQDWTLIY